MKKIVIVLLLVAGFGTLYNCKDNSYPVPPATTEPGFTYVLDNTLAPATATFTNTTVIPERAGDVTYYWSFGDSTSSQEKSPAHLYEFPGAFLVKLVVITSKSAEINEYSETLVIVDPNGSGTATYTTDGKNVYVANLNSQAPIFTKLFSGIDASYALVVDTAANKIYISDETGGKIVRADIDGTNKVDWRTGMGVVDGMAIDYKMHQIYFENEDGIRRSDMTVDTPTQYEDVVTGQSALDPEGLAIDSVNRKLYWNTYNSPGGIWMKDLDSPGGETQIVPGSATPESGGGGSIIVVNNKIFYDDYDLASDLQVLRSANLNGTGVATVATDISRVIFALAYHPQTNKVYWGDRTPGIIMRADPDGSNAEPWYTNGATSPRGMAFGRTKQ